MINLCQKSNTFEIFDVPINNIRSSTVRIFLQFLRDLLLGNSKFEIVSKSKFYRSNDGQNYAIKVYYF